MKFIAFLSLLCVMTIVGFVTLYYARKKKTGWSDLSGAEEVVLSLAIIFLMLLSCIVSTYILYT